MRGTSGGAAAGKAAYLVASPGVFASVLLLAIVFVVPLVADDLPAQGTEALVVDPFAAERLLLQSYVSGGATTPPAPVFDGFSAELFDGFSRPRGDVWEEWRGAQTKGGSFTFDGDTLTIEHPLETSRHSVGVRSLQRLVTVPAHEGDTFFIRLVVDTQRSCSGALVLTPQQYPTLNGRPQIRLQYRRGEKIGTVSLHVGDVSAGSFKVPLATRYGMGLLIGDRKVMALDSKGKVVVTGDLPSWAVPGTALYLWLCAVACPMLGEGRFTIDSIRLRHPLTMASAGCLVWEYFGDVVLDESFVGLDRSAWTTWYEGSAPPGAATTVTDEGLLVAVPGGERFNKWGRSGIRSVGPFIESPVEDGVFTVIELQVDTERTSGARMVLTTSAEDEIWNSPHIRLGLERRGLVTEAWFGDQQSIGGQFQLPIVPSCLVTVLIGRRGVHVVGPDCRLRASVPLPTWARDVRRFHLWLYSHSPRPSEPAVFVVRQVRVVAGCRAPAARDGDGFLAVVGTYSTTATTP